MTTKYYALLEAKIEEWIEENCEELNVWWPKNSAEPMAKAAAAIFDAWVAGQEIYMESAEDE